MRGTRFESSLGREPPIFYFAFRPIRDAPRAPYTPLMQNENWGLGSSASLSDCRGRFMGPLGADQNLAVTGVDHAAVSEEVVGLDFE